MAAPFPALLSVVVVFRSEEARLEPFLRAFSSQLATLATDHELIVVDNGSTDSSVDRLRILTRPEGIPNLQVFCLTKEVDFDTAAWAGVESALGDYVAVLDPLREDPQFLPKLIEAATAGADVVFAENENRSGRGLVYGI